MLPNIQSCFLPRRPSTRFGGVEIAHFWQPLDEIGGDFLYYEKVNERLLSFEIGDVTGHGVRSGLVMTALHGLIFGLRQSGEPVERVLANANAFLCRLQQLETQRDPQGMARMLMASMFALQIDFHEHVLVYCNAGHPAALYAINGSDGPVLSLRTGGPILGAFPASGYRVGRLRPAAGDVILLFTDGVSETLSESGEEFTVSRVERLLLDLVGAPPREIVAQVNQTIRDFRGDSFVSDDIAIAAVKFGENW